MSDSSQQANSNTQGERPVRKYSHLDTINWQDEPPHQGVVRTCCRICCKFIGYRPMARPRKKNVPETTFTVLLVRPASLAKRLEEAAITPHGPQQVPGRRRDSAAVILQGELYAALMRVRQQLLNALRDTLLQHLVSSE